jgi:hypothetical protein
MGGQGAEILARSFYKIVAGVSVLVNGIEFAFEPAVGGAKKPLPIIDA